MTILEAEEKVSRFISILGIEVVTIEPEDALKALREVGCHQPGRILLRTAAKVVGYNFRRQASKSRYAGNGVRHTPRSDAWRKREKCLPQHLPQHTTAGEGRKPRRGSDRQEENEDDQNIL